MNTITNKISNVIKNFTKDPNIEACKAITGKIFEMIEVFNKKHGTTPWDINNGLCDELARNVVSELDYDSNNLFEIEFLNITDTADDDWNNFYEKAIEAFNLRITRGLEEELFMKTLREFADTSHMWVVYKNENFCLHFDSESPYGVDNPFKLKTFDKFLKVAHLNLTYDELCDHLQVHKEESVKDYENFKKNKVS